MQYLCGCTGMKQVLKVWSDGKAAQDRQKRII